MLVFSILSFGITLWEIATRQHPYEGQPPFRVVFLVGTQGSRPTIPNDCDEVENLLTLGAHFADAVMLE